MKRLISVVIPCYNEAQNIEKAYALLKKTTGRLGNYSFEYVFVDNGSEDESRKQITKIANKDSRVKGIFLSRNFGPESSAQAGFDHAKGDALIAYPCDMQEPASLFPIFIKKWEEGYDSVIGIYTKTEDLFWMKFLRKIFYNIMKVISNIDIPINNSGYGLYSRKVIDAMKNLPEKFRFGRGIRAWVGFTTSYISYERKPRLYGKSSYSLINYFKHAERSVFGFSYLPLDLLIYAGLFLVACSFLFIIGYIIFFFLFGNPIKGAVTILVSIVFFGGINLLALSIIGKYIQVIVEETKARPTYIIDSIITKAHTT